MSTAHKGWAIGGGLMAVAIGVATACSADVHDAAPPSAAASSSVASSAAATVAPAADSSSSSSSAATSTAAATTTTTTTPPAMPAAQASATRAELAALAKRLPGRVTLTPPATWARYAGTTPDYAEDVTSCPHLATTLGGELGRTWTYAYGKLPTGPAGCTWTPVPWVPDRPPADRLFVSIGYQAGPVADLLGQPGYCAGGALAPTLPAPTAGSGARLDGCLDQNGTQLGLSVADPAGTGVWTLGVHAGSHQPVARAADALLALVDGARTAYR